MDPTIYVVNHSTQVSDNDAGRMATAWAVQLAHHIAPFYGRIAVPVLFWRGGKKLPTQARLLTLQNTCDDPQALGYHTEDGSEHIYGVIGTEVPLANGATALTGAYSVSTIGSHEVAELFLDPFCTTTADTGQGFGVCYEIADPVQDGFYPVSGVDVSNFVTPEWFNPQPAPHTQFDYLDVLRQPFSMTSGGYWVQWREGKSTQKFGDACPEWVQQMKQDNPYSRINQR
jgi:hypothetical protein